MLKLYFENFKNGELSFAVEDEQGDRIDRFYFTGDNIPMPQVFDAAVIIYLPEIIKSKQKFEIMGPVSAGLLSGIKKWVSAMDYPKIRIHSDLKVGNYNYNTTWLMMENVRDLNIEFSGEIEDNKLAHIAIGMLFANKYKGVLLEGADMAYELLSTNNFQILANGRPK